MDDSVQDLNKISENPSAYFQTLLEGDRVRVMG